MKFIKQEWLFIIVVSIAALLFINSMFPQNDTTPDTCVVEEAASPPVFSAKEINSNLIGMLGGFLLGAAFIILFLKKSKPSRDLLREYARWGFWDIFKIGALYIVVLVVLLGGFSSYFQGYDRDVLRIIADVTARLVICVAIIAVVVGQRMNGYAALGLQKNLLRNRLRESVFGYLAFLPFFFGLTFFTWLLFYVLGENMDPQGIVKSVAAEQDKTIILLWILVICVMAPISEELFFRGLLYGYMRERIGGKWAIFLSGVVFALLHGNTFSLIPIAALGIWLAILYERNRDITVPIIAHAIFNSLSLVLILAG